MAPDLSSAWLLHRRPYKESSVIAEFLVEHQGRVAMVVKGARKPRSTKAPLLQPFSQVMVAWRGRGELKTLHGIEPSCSYRLSGNSLFCGMYINELILRTFLPGQPADELFQLYHLAIKALSEQASVQPVLRFFELQLLQLMGYLPSFECDAETGQVLDADSFYLFQPGAGFMRVEQGVMQSDHRYLYHAGVLSSLANRDFSNVLHYPDFKRFTRQALAGVLGDRPLKSRELFVRANTIKK